MQRYLIIRTGQAILTLFALSILTFFLIRHSNHYLLLNVLGHPSPEEIERIERAWHLDKPLVVQYFHHMKDMLQGDWGFSWKWGDGALDIVLERFPATVQLASITLAISAMLGLTFGVLAAVHRGTPFDQAGKVLTLLGLSLPSFWLGIVLMWLFAVLLGWLPVPDPGWPTASGGEETAHLVLPTITMSLFFIAALMNLTRSGMMEALDSEHVKLARIKGLPEWKVIVKHSLRNVALLPLNHFLMLGGFFFTAIVVVETVFAWPGVGLLAIEATLSLDYGVIYAVTLFMGSIFILTHLLADLLKAYLDPRIRFYSRQPVHGDYSHHDPLALATMGNSWRWPL